MFRKLRTTERQDLIASHRRESDRRICDRIKAVLAYDRGLSYAEISVLLLLDDETIRRHLSDYFSRDKKLSCNNGGSQSDLDSMQTEQLIAHLSEHIYLYVKDICHYVKSNFNVRYSISGMNKWLRRNGFTYKKPARVPAKADITQQASFVSDYHQLKDSMKADEHLYFVDSVHPEHQTRLAYGWIKKGERKSVKTTGRQKRLNIIGGLRLNGHKIIHHQAERVNSESIQAFLLKLRRHHPCATDTLHILLDNAAYHRSAEVKSCAEQLNIKLHYLPPYSPNLNPIERLWKIMHEQVTYNQYYEKFSDFTEAIIRFLNTIGRKKKILRSRINDNFHILDNYNLAS